MIGRRLPDDLDPLADETAQPGDYWHHGGVWYCMTPSNHAGCLVLHEVTEHDDGTITVSPSILIARGTGTEREQELYHGFLQQGVWRSA